MNKTLATLAAGAVLAAPLAFTTTASATEVACTPGAPPKSAVKVSGFSAEKGVATFTVTGDFCDPAPVVLAKYDLPKDWASQTGLAVPQSLGEYKTALVRSGQPTTLHIANVTCGDVQVDAYYGTVVKTITSTQRIGDNLFTAKTLHTGEDCVTDTPTPTPTPTPQPPVETPKPPVVVTPPVDTPPVAVTPTPPVAVVVAPQPVKVSVPATPKPAVVIPTRVESGTGGQAASVESSSHVTTGIASIFGGILLLGTLLFKRSRA